MNCPQCATGLGEGAKACATCGWSASRRTLWIVLGCIFGFLCLVCCGAGTFLYFKMKKVMEAVQGDVVPLQVSILRAQVVNFARAKGKPPATLEEAAGEPMIGRNGEKVEIKFQNDNRTSDMWQRPFRFSVKDDRTFEVRSAGPDGQFDDADDIFEKGSLDDDLPALQEAIKEKGRRLGESAVRAFGLDPKNLEEKNGPAPAPVPAPTPPGGGK